VEPGVSTKSDYKMVIARQEEDCNPLSKYMG